MIKKIKTPEDLKNLRDKAKGEIDLRSGPKEIQITVHMGTCGIAAGARDIVKQLGSELLRAKVENVTLRQSGCIGLCDREPMMTLTDTSGRRFLYGKLNKVKVHEIVQRHILGGNPLNEYIIGQ